MKEAKIFNTYSLIGKRWNENMKYFQDGKINIFEIGKYQERKNHFLMLKAFKKIKEKYPNAHLYIAGDVSDKFQEEYFNKMKKFLKKEKLEDYVTLYRNLKREKVKEIYRKTDLFVIPSTGEPGAVSHLEAMAFSIPAIGGSDNGTADYIVDGETGYIFEDNNVEDLVEKISLIIGNPEEVKRMSRNAYKHVKENFRFEKYYKSVRKILKRYGK